MTAHGSDDLNFRYVTTILRRRWKLVLSFALLGVAIGILVAAVMPPRYTAKAQIMMEPQVTAVANVIDDAAVDTRVELLLSAGHLRRLLNNLHNTPAAEVAGVPPLTSRADRLHALWYRIAAQLRWLSRDTREAVGQPGASPLPTTVDRPVPELTDLTFDDLERRIDVFKERRSRVIAVTYTSTAPNIAAAVANRAVEVYVDDLRNQRMAARADTLRRLEKRIPETKMAMEMAESALRYFAIANGFFDGAPDGGEGEKIAQINRQLVIARSELAARRQQLDAAGQPDGASTSLQKGQNGRLLAGRLLESSAVVGVREPLPDHDASVVPDAVGAPPIDDDSRASDDESKALRRLALDTQVVDARVEYLERWKSTLQDALTQTLQSELQYRDLARDAASAAQVYEGLMRKQAEFLGQDDVHADARIVSLASVPEEPSSADAVLFIMPAAVFALLCGGFLAIVLERTDRRIWSERTLSDVLGVPCISQVPRLSSYYRKHPHLLLAREPFSTFANALRSVVAASLQFHNGGSGFGLSLVTSSGPGEGKTTLAVSLATYAAMLKRRVLLVDMDFRNPGLLQGFEKAEGHGILDVLDGLAVADRVRIASGLNIDYLPLPRENIDPLAVFAHAGLPSFLLSLKDTYDCVVIDGSHVVGAADAGLMAGWVDRVIFVTKWGGTTLDVAEAALSRMHAYAPATNRHENIYSVLTKVDLGKHLRCRYGEAI